MLTPAVENYLKTICEIESRGEKVTTTLLAERLGVSPASVTGMVKKLAEMNLVAHQPYQGVTLREAGRKIALEVIRHHRLVETYLHEAMGVPWDKVHDEAEKWEHVLSEEIEDRIDEILGHPTHDPHGSPIPTRAGEIPATSNVRLIEIESGHSARITQIHDHSPEMLRYLDERGLRPGAELAVLAVEPLDGPLTVRVGEAEQVLGHSVACHIAVDEIAAAAGGR